MLWFEGQAEGRVLLSERTSTCFGDIPRASDERKKQVVNSCNSPPNMVMVFLIRLLKSCKLPLLCCTERQTLLRVGAGGPCAWCEAHPPSPPYYLNSMDVSIP